PRREESSPRIAVRRVEQAGRLGHVGGRVDGARGDGARQCERGDRERCPRARERLQYTREPAEVVVPIRTVVFDLFDTLVDLRWERLPVTEHRGKKLPASTPALHARVRTRCDVDLDAFVDTMAQGD